MWTNGSSTHSVNPPVRGLGGDACFAATDEKGHRRRHGHLGMTPLARMYTMPRHLRLAEGPDEVHWHVVGRAELARYEDDHAPAVVKTTATELGGQFTGPAGRRSATAFTPAP